MRARGAVRRQQPGVGFELVEIFRDRQRVPDLDAVMRQARHQEGGREQQQFGAGGGVVARQDLLVEIEARHLAEQPAAQRPGAVVLAADRECGLGHGALAPLGAPTPKIRPRDTAARLSPAAHLLSRSAT